MKIMTLEAESESEPSKFVLLVTAICNDADLIHRYVEKKFPHIIKPGVRMTIKSLDVDSSKDFVVLDERTHD